MNINKGVIFLPPWFFFLFLLLFPVITFANLIVHDSQGQTISLTKPARRIISLAPNLTEILYAIGAGKWLVGVSSSTDYPVAATHLPVIANDVELNLESILLLHPDLVVVWAGGNSATQLAQLAQLHIPIYQARFQTISDISAVMKNLSVLTRTESIADPLIRNFEKTFSDLKEEYGAQKRVTVFYQISATPLFTVNHASTINQIITLCGGQNIFAKALSIAPQVSLEAVIAANPEVIISTEMHNDWQKAWLTWPNITATKNHHLFTIPPDLIERPGPRLAQGAQLLCQDLAAARQK